MPVIDVVKRFMLKDENNKLTEFDVGQYEVDADVADHWYVKPHLKGYEPPAPQRGTAAFAEAELRVSQAVRMGAGLPTPGGTPSSQARDMTGATPDNPRRSGEPQTFAGRVLPKGPNELQMFNDPRMMWPRSGVSLSEDRADDPQRVGQNPEGGIPTPLIGETPALNQRQEPPPSGISESKDRAQDPQGIGDQPQRTGGVDMTQAQRDAAQAQTKSWKESQKK